MRAWKSARAGHRPDHQSALSREPARSRARAPAVVSRRQPRQRRGDQDLRRSLSRVRGVQEGAHRRPRHLRRRRHDAPHADRDDPHLRRRAAAAGGHLARRHHEHHRALVRHLRRDAAADVRARRPPPSRAARDHPVVRARDPAGRRRLRLHLRQRHHLQLPARVLRDGGAVAGRRRRSSSCAPPARRWCAARWRDASTSASTRASSPTAIAGRARTSSPSRRRWSSRSGSASSRSIACTSGRSAFARARHPHRRGRLRRRAAQHPGRQADAARQGDRSVGAPRASSRRTSRSSTSSTGTRTFRSRGRWAR